MKNEIDEKLETILRSLHFDKHENVICDEDDSIPNGRRPYKNGFNVALTKAIEEIKILFNTN
jgi:hypothetical protein